MNIAWSRRKLSPQGYRAQEWVAREDHHRNGFDCMHSPTAERELLTPVMRRSFRVEGKPRSKIVYRPAIGLRTCCLADVDDPMPRIGFWWSFDHRLSEAPLSVRPMKEWMREEIGKRVPVMTADDRLLAALYFIDLEWFDGKLSRAEMRREQLRRARSRVADYLRTREPGETPEMWKARKKAPPKPPPKPPPDYSYVNFGAAWNIPTPSDCGVLGLTWPFSTQEAKKAYRVAALARHPDRGGSHNAFIELQAAWQRIAAVVGA